MLKQRLQLPPLNSTRANIVWASASQAIEKLAGYLVIAVLTRTLLKSDLGALFFALSIAEITATVWNFGSDTLLIRMVASSPKDALAHFNRVLSVRLFNVGAGYLLVLLATWLLRPALLPVLALVAAYDYLEEIHFCFLALFTGQKQQMYRLAMFGGFKVFVFIAVSLAALLTRSIFAVLWVYVGLNAALLLIASAVVSRQFGAIRLRFDPRSGIPLLKSSAPFFFINFLTILHMRLDTILVGVWLGLAQLAAYELGIKMMEVARFVVRPLHSVFFPVFSEYIVRGDWDTLRARSALLGAAALVAGSLFAVGMYFFAGPLIALLFGPNYADSAQPARILFLSVPMMYLSMLATTLALAMHRERASGVLLGLCVALNFGLNWWWIPSLGTLGAAWATVISQAALLVLMLGITLGPFTSSKRRRAGEPALEDLTPPALT